MKRFVLIVAALLLVVAPSVDEASGNAIEPWPTTTMLGTIHGGAPAYPRDLDSYAKRVGGLPAIVSWYRDWTEPLIVPAELSALRDRGVIPLITWEPHDSSVRAAQPAFSLRAIAGGRYDVYLRRSAQDAARWGGRLFLRPAHEMNIGSYSWGVGVNGNTAADFVLAWRRIHGIFEAAGADNVTWVWSPNVDYGGAPFTQLFPGDDVVDWLALDGYSWGPLKASGFRSLIDIFADSYRAIGSLSPDPMMIAETAANEAGGDKAAWIRAGFLADLPRRLPRVKAAIWFDRDKETDWRVASSPAALAAYREVVAAPHHQPPPAGPQVAPRPGATSRRCLARPLRIGATGLGPVRLGALGADVVNRLGPPTGRIGTATAYCLGGGGDVAVLRSPRRKVSLVVAFAPPRTRFLGARGLTTGVSLRSARRSLRRVRRVSRHVYVAAIGRTPVVALVQDGQIFALGVTTQALARDRVALRRLAKGLFAT